jgi:hypothetical protein
MHEVDISVFVSSHFRCVWDIEAAVAMAACMDFGSSSSPSPVNQAAIRSRSQVQCPVSRCKASSCRVP